MKRVLLSVFVLLLLSNVLYSEKPFTIPAIHDWQDLEGEFQLQDDIYIDIEEVNYDDLIDIALTFQNDLFDMGYSNVILNKTELAIEGHIFLKLDNKLEIKNEGYKLTIDDSIIIESNNLPGIFYGTRTLLQLLKQYDSIPKGIAFDEPLVRERGLMLDVGRKYLSMDWLRNYIKEISYSKMNYLHLHLTSNEGYRLDSKIYPNIVSEEHYSDDDIIELEELASRYYVEIVPEITLPAHSKQIIDGINKDLAVVFDDGFVVPYHIDITKDTVWTITKELIEENISKFSSKYWHVGADEYLLFNFVPSQFIEYAKNRIDPDAIPQDVFVYYINRVDSLVKSHGKILRMWNDGFSHKETDSNIVLFNREIILDYWNGPRSPQEAIDSGFTVANRSQDNLYYIVGSGYIGYYDFLYPYWTSNTFHSHQTVNVNSTKFLGTSYSVWADKAEMETEEHIAYSIHLPIRIISNKTWGSELAPPTWQEFEKKSKELGFAPSVSFPENPMQGNILFRNIPQVSSNSNKLEDMPELLTDGSYHTGWSADNNPNQSITFDLQDTFRLNRIKIFWYRYRPQEFSFSISNDNLEWTDIEFSDTYENADFRYFTEVEIDEVAKYLRLELKQLGDSSYHAVYEIEAYGELYDPISSVKEKEFNNELDFSIFPNPSKGIFSLEINSVVRGYSAVNIYDLEGNKLLTKELGILNSGINKSEIKTNLPSGFYYVVVNIDNQFFRSAKLIIE